MALSGKVVFITGAAQGLGRGYTEAVLENGAKVFFGDVNSDIGAATLGELQARFGAANVRFAAFDVTNHQQFKEAFEQAVAEFGHVDVMVNNAGIMNEAVWELMININFVSLVLGTKLATEHMRRDQGGRGGRIINISSIAGLNDIPSIPVYCGTKHAVRSFTSSLALQPNIQAQGIEYGVLCPHAAATDLILKTDSDKIFFYDLVKDRLKTDVMPVQTVVDGFMELLQLEKMNGAILMVKSEGNTFQKMENNQDTDRA
jgi:15-hydroxyprostaglandin dehydrogenase (NAD)